MGTFTVGEVRAKAAGRTTFQKNAAQVLLEAVRAQSAFANYDIFLSHASADAEIILGVREALKELGHTVYVDWLDDPQLDRSKVTPQTAQVLRTRMGLCRSLFYTTTSNSGSSKWMPWECGYFDGKCGRTAILPVTTVGREDFDGQEYLGLYPYIVKGQRAPDYRERLWVHREPKIYVSFSDWLAGKQPISH